MRATPKRQKPPVGSLSWVTFLVNKELAILLELTLWGGPGGSLRSTEEEFRK